MTPPDDTPIYAHTLKDQPPERWELLNTHSVAVAKLASEFSASPGFKIGFLDSPVDNLPNNCSY